MASKRSFNHIFWVLHILSTTIAYFCIIVSEYFMAPKNTGMILVFIPFYTVVFKSKISIVLQMATKGFKNWTFSPNFLTEKGRCTIVHFLMPSYPHQTSVTKTVSTQHACTRKGPTRGWEKEREKREKSESKSQKEKENKPTRILFSTLAPAH